MRIRKLYLKDIGPFDEVEFEFKPQEKGKAEIHILTGPNGSGKTTVLHALASIFSKADDFNNPSLNNAFVKRFRDLWKKGHQRRLLASFDNGKDIEVNINVSEEEGELWRSIDLSQFNTNNSIEAYRQRAHWPPDTEFFVAAYSGYRYLRAVNVNAIQEAKNDPFSDALNFTKETNNSFTLNQWIANNISKRALEKEKSNQPLAKKYASLIARLETVISEIAGYKIEFSLKTSPLTLVLIANNAELDFDVLPDGLRSAISWIGDLLMRIDLAPWEYGEPLSLILFLDEIEVHLHPAWQRKVLPAVQKLFPNAQIFLTTHSPFVVNSVDGAAIYELKVNDGKAYLGEVSESKSSASYRSVLREVFDVEKPFGGETQDELDKFQLQRDQLLKGEEVSEKQFIQRARKLAKQSEELLSIISLEIKQINKIKGTNFEL